MTVTVEVDVMTAVFVPVTIILWHRELARNAFDADELGDAELDARSPFQSGSQISDRRDI